MNLERGMERRSPGVVTYTPDRAGEKLAFLVASLLLLALGTWMLWVPLGRFLLGHRAVGYVSHVVRVEPGHPEQTFRFRRAYPAEQDWDVRFQHFLSVREGDRTTTKRLGVDSRIQPLVNVNDRVEVMFHPGEAVALEVRTFRTWGFGVATFALGLVAVGCSLPTWLAVGKPILVDPDAPSR